jgi:hypothetical protein
MTALPSRFAHPGSKREHELIQVYGAMDKERAAMYVRVMAYLVDVGFIKTKPALKSVRRS